MAKAGAVWVSVLPDMSGWNTAVRAQAGVALGGVGKESGLAYGRSLVSAARDSMSPLRGAVTSQASASASELTRVVDQAASKAAAAQTKLEGASAKVSAALRKEADAAGAVRLAQVRLDAARRAASGAPTERQALALARAEEAVAKADRQATAASGEVMRAQRAEAGAAEAASRAQRGLAAATELQSKSTAGAGVTAAAAGGKFSKFHAGVADGSSKMTSKVGELTKGAAAMGGVFAGFEAVKFAGESVHAAQEFEKGSNVLVTAAGESQKDIGMIRQGLLDISSATGTSLEQMTEGMYTVEKAGYRGSKGLSIMDAAAKGAKDEGADLGIVTNALTTIMFTSNGKINDGAKAMNALMVAAGSSKTSLQDYANSLSSVLPVSSKLGIGFDQVAGALGTMTASGMSAQQASQNLNHTITSLAAPNRVAANMMQAFGVSAKDVKDNLGKRGLQGTIEMLSDAVKSKLKGAAAEAADTISQMPEKYQEWWVSLENGTMTMNTFEKKVGKAKDLTKEQKDRIMAAIPASQGYAEAMLKMTGGIVGLNTSMMLTGNSHEKFKKGTEEVGHALHNTEDFTHKWALAQGTASNSMAIARQTISNVGTALAMQLMPAIAKVATLFAHLVTTVVKFTRVNWSWLRFVALGIGAVVAGLVLWNTTARISAALQLGWAAATGTATLATEAQTKATRLGAVAAKAFAGAQWLIRGAMAGNPLSLAIIGFAALAAGLVLAYKKSETFRNIVQGVWSSIRSALGAVVGWFRDTAWPIMLRGLQAVGDAASWLWSHAIKPAWAAIQSASVWLFDHVIKPGAAAAGAAFRAIGAAASWLWTHAIKPALGFIVSNWRTFVGIIAIPLAPILAPAIGAFLLLRKYGGAALGAIADAAKWLWSNAIKPMADQIGRALPAMWNGAVRPALSGMWSALQTVGRWGSWLWSNALAPAFKAIGTGVGWLWDHAMRPALTAAWTVVKTLGNWWQWLWPVIGAAVKGIGSGILWLWEHAARPAFSGIQTAGTLMWKYVLAPIFAIWLTTLTLVGKALTALWDHAVRPIFGWIAGAAQKMWDYGVKPAFSSIVGGAKALGAGIQWAWDHVIKGAFSIIGGGAKLMWEHVIRPAFDGVKAGARALGVGIQWAWDHVIHPVFNAIGGGAKVMWERVIRPALDDIKRGFSAAGAGIRYVWDHAIHPAFDAIGAGAKWMWEHVIRPAFDDIKRGITGVGSGIKWAWERVIHPAFDAIGAAAKWMWEHVAKPAFDGMKRGIDGLGTGIKWVWEHVIKGAFNGIMDLVGRDDRHGVRGAFHSAVGSIGKIWDTLKGIVAKPINAVIRFINDPFLSTFNSISKTIGGGFKIGPIKTIGGYASGGILPGRSTWRDGDDQVIRARRGEGIYVSEAMQDPRERDRLFAVNAAAMRGESLDRFHAPQGFATGGRVEGSGGGGGGGAATRAGASVPHRPGMLGALIAFGHELQRRGMAVLEQQSFTPVHRVHMPGSLHYTSPSEALDVSGGPGWPNSGGAVFNEALARGFGAIWQSRGHYDHVHIDTGLYRILHDVTSRIGGATTWDASATASGGGGFLANLWDAVGGTAGRLLKAAGGSLSTMLGGLTGSLGKVLGKIADSPFGKIATGALRKVGGMVVDHLNPFKSQWDEGQGTLDPALLASLRSQQFDDWWRQAVAVAGHGYDRFKGAAQIVAKYESGFDPTRANHWDSNAKAGTPSAGLMQFIKPTFDAYRWPGHGTWMNPVDQILAFLRYAPARYGSPDNVPGVKAVRAGRGYVGYHTGTDSAEPGPAYVAERGAEIVLSPQLRQFRGGEQVLDAARTRELLGGGTTINVEISADSLDGIVTVQQFLDVVNAEARMRGGI